MCIYAVVCRLCSTLRLPNLDVHREVVLNRGYHALHELEEHKQVAIHRRTRTAAAALDHHFQYASHGGRVLAGMDRPAKLVVQVGMGVESYSLFAIICHCNIGVYIN